MDETDQGPNQQGDSTGGMPVPPPPQPMTPPPVSAPAVASGVGAPADLMTRFLARLIDHILLGIATFIVLLIVAIAFVGVGSQFGFFGGFNSGNSGGRNCYSYFGYNYRYFALM